jgi:glycine/D-amino acid oxidase-like deaminating enzyme
MRVAVIGAGAVGLSAAWNARRAGHEVTVFEQGPIPNPLAASMDQHRLCRMPYGAQEGYAALMPRAYAAWERMWSALGERHYAEAGCLSLHTDDGDWTEQSRASLARLGFAHRVLSREEVAARCPHLRVEDVRWGLWSEPGGLLFADRITQGLAHLCAASGVTLLADTKVLGVEESGAVTTAHGTRGFDAVVVTVGVWAGRLMPDLAPRIREVRQVVAYVRPPEALRAAWERSPILIDMGRVKGMYGCPPLAGRGLKLGYGPLNQTGDPDLRRSPEPGEAGAILAAWAPRLVQAEGYAIESARVCGYAGTEDGVFVTEARGRLIAMTGCSGHAFKFSALLGEGLAEALERGPAALAWMRGELAPA